MGISNAADKWLKLESLHTASLQFLIIGREFLILILSFFLFLEYQKKKRIEISNKFNKLIISYENKKNTELIKKELIELVLSKDKTYAPLSLYFLIDNKIIKSSNKINELFDLLIENNSLDKEVIQKPNDTLKYQEDKSLKDLTDYVNTTYEGHYTSDQGDNVQTLDIIESVGDAKSFCRSNAIKYLTRYEKKGQAKRDILKAAHYCLLLYYFDGHTNWYETIWQNN